MDAGMTERESVALLGTGLREGHGWLQMSTVGVEGAERAAELLDAPVLGSQPAAEGGTLIVLGSGPDDVRERVAPVLHAVSARTVWLGEAGAGQRLKLVANACVLVLVER